MNIHEFHIEITVSLTNMYITQGILINARISSNWGFFFFGRKIFHSFKKP